MVSRSKDAKNFGIRQTWICIPVLPLTSLVYLGKSLSLSEPQPLRGVTRPHVVVGLNETLCGCTEYPGPTSTQSAERTPGAGQPARRPVNSILLNLTAALGSPQIYC